MDDLDFIKRDVNKHLHEGIVFNDAGHMLRSLLLDIKEHIMELNDDLQLNDGHLDGTAIIGLEDIYEKYTDARVR